MTKQEIIPWYDADLTTRLALGMRYCERILFPEYENRPHFGYASDGNGEGIGRGCPGDLMAHAVGRGMDLMYNYEKYTGNKLAPYIEAAYVRHFYEALDEEYGLCIEYIAENEPWRIYLHNCRETIEALTLLVEMRNDGHAVAVMEKIFKSFELFVDPDSGKYSKERLAAHGIDMDEKFVEPDSTQPRTTGRFTGPLMEYYRVTKDSRALYYASVFARGTLAGFADDGSYIEGGEIHVHSITSSLSGAADYAAYTKNDEMLGKIVRICENPLGIPQMITDFGWGREIVGTHFTRGEVNQTADVEMLFLILGNYYHNAYWYSKAEVYLRGSILPAQVLRNDFLKPTENPESDHKRDIPSRILGGYGFPLPSSHGDGSTTLDITQGANQAICRTMDHAVTVDGYDIYVNMLLTHDSSAARVRSELPKIGRIDVLPKREGKLHVRLPESVGEGSVRLFLDGCEVEYASNNGYLICDVRAYDLVTLSFAPKRYTYETECNGKSCTVTRFGEQVISVEPIEELYPLYGEF